MKKMVQTAGRDALGEFAPDEWFSHLAIEVPGVETSNEWCEAVSEQEYARLR